MKVAFPPSEALLRIIRSLPLGKVNSAGRLYLVIESVRPDTKNLWESNAPAYVGGAGGSVID
jgi:hypothetical protein